jgi:hypothetical protein
MPRQSLLCLIKRWKRYELREKWPDVPLSTRGVYVLYEEVAKDTYNTIYIGVAGLGSTGGGGVRGRLKRHNVRIKNWTHFSLFEVHDNITADEIREIEALLLGIFRHDPRMNYEQAKGFEEIKPVTATYALET